MTYRLLCLSCLSGSFINNGGHNYIEPAAWGIPIISGPSRYNFQQISDLLIAENALTIVENYNELSLEWKNLLSDTTLRSSRGLASKKVAEDNRGSLKRTTHTIDQALIF